MSMPVPFIYPTFMGLPCGTLGDAAPGRIVVMGAAEASPYDPAEASHSAQAPGAIRAASKVFAGQLYQHDFDLGFTPLDGRPTDIATDWIGVDIGDVATKPKTAAVNRDRIAAAVEQVLAAGAFPVVLGGDDSVPVPVLAGYDWDADAHGPVTIVQIDAHVDWADTIRGEDNGYGSPMRRAAEMPWVGAMLQVGIRGLGSGEAWQHDDARAYGSHLVSARAWHAAGADAILDRLPAGGRYVVCVDCDGIDPAVFPAVAMPTPGGLTYEDCLGLLHGLAARGQIVGVVIAEYVPDRDDAHRTCALTAARLAAVAALLMRGRD